MYDNHNKEKVMNSFEITFDCPTTIELAKKWADRISESMKRASKFLDIVQWFSNRYAFNLELANGHILRDHPCYGSLYCGTREDFDRHFLLSEDYIRPYSEMIIPTESYFHIPRQDQVEYQYLNVSRDLPAWKVISHNLKIEACSHILIVRGVPHGNEVPAFFFPYVWGNQKNIYLIIQIGSLTQMTLFQGSIEDWETDHHRDPRGCELNQYVKNREKWRPPTVPTTLAMDYQRLDDKNQPIFNNPKEIYMTDVFNATQRLTSFKDNT